MLISNISYLHLKTFDLPYVAFKEFLKEVSNKWKKITRRELNPGLLCESLTTLPLDQLGELE